MLKPLLLLALLAPAACGAVPDAAPAQAAPPRRVALTLDDLPVVSTTRGDLPFQRRVTDGILEALRRHDAPAVGFVNEDKLEAGGELDPARVALLRRWLDAGHELGNHTYGHPDLHRTPLADFRADVLRGERVTRALLAERGQAPRWFRHPFLHTGRSVAVRDSLHAFLAAHGYRVAPVTVDNYDYQFAAAYDRSLQGADTAAASRVVEEYLAYMDSVFGYYEAQSRTHLGREPAQVLLLHANALNAAALDRLLALLERRGYAFVPLEEALRDEAYRLADGYAGPAGITWLHRWALTAGAPGASFAGEPEVPAWVVRAAGG